MISLELHNSTKIQIFKIYSGFRFTANGAKVIDSEPKIIIFRLIFNLFILHKLFFLEGETLQDERADTKIAFHTQPTPPNKLFKYLRF